ncbi:hypothetical protein [Halocatena salina]|uniref:Uncharacterized protein n=1 Tax=Halocatena salina TaxID=2934340 RepID=A0A8U0A5Z0_9EURY|nr:hypothetical protein [Halocatena salina]UPM44591.1 hypothetical protein MW046_16200 [Halocatena salina]
MGWIRVSELVDRLAVGHRRLPESTGGERTGNGGQKEESNDADVDYR